MKEPHTINARISLPQLQFNDQNILVLECQLITHTHYGLPFRVRIRSIKELQHIYKVLGVKDVYEINKTVVRLEFRDDSLCATSVRIGHLIDDIWFSYGTIRDEELAA